MERPKKPLPPLEELAEIPTGRFVLEVLPDGRFRWHFDRINPITLLGMLDCAAHELREKMRAEEFGGKKAKGKGKR